MRRTLFIWCIFLGVFWGTASADVGSLEFSGGVVAPYDVSSSDSAVGWQLSYAIGVTDHFEIGAMLMETGDFEAENDITDGEVEISTILIQGRWIFFPEEKTRGFVDLGGGMMDVSPESSSSISSRSGGAIRMGVGVDRELARGLAIRLGLGYTTGVGRTSEIDVIDASVSLVFGVKLLE